MRPFRFYPPSENRRLIEWHTGLFGIWLLLLLPILPRTLGAQTLYFEHLSEKDGLSSNSVTCLLQDRQGFLWIGTKDGLNRYDGTRFRVFSRYRNDSTSISNNYILCLWEDRRGYLWVGTQAGLNRFDPRTEKFQRFIRQHGAQFEAENYIHSVKEDRRGYIWYGTYNGLFRLHTQTGASRQFLPDSLDVFSLPHPIVWTVDEDRDGRLWFGTRNGLAVCANDDRFRFEKYGPEAGNSHALANDNVWQLVQQPDNTRWLASNNGLFQLIPSGKTLHFKRWQHLPKQPNSLSDNYIQYLYADGNYRLWAATYNGGLNEMYFPDGDKTRPRITRHLHDANQPGSISHNEVHTVLRDRSGILWVGTEGGLDKADPHGRKCRVVQHRVNEPLSLRSNHITALLFDSRGNLWVGTRGGGLHRLPKDRLRRRQFQFEIFQHQAGDPYSLSNNDVYGLFEDSQGYLWINTYDGLNYLNLNGSAEKPRFRHLNTANGLPHKFSFQVFESARGGLWVASYGKLARMFFDPRQPEKTRFKNYDMDLSRSDALANALTFTLAEDRFGQLWIGTFNGLSKCLDTAGPGRFENYRNQPGNPASLGNNIVNQLYCDSKGRLWAATNGGLDFFEQKSASAPVVFQHFGLPEGLSGEIIRSICEAPGGMLWLGTTKGLILFDPELALQANAGSPVQKVLDFQDGLLGNEFAERAACCSPEGLLWFGGLHGLNYVDPGALVKNPYAPPVVFTEFRLFNRAVRPDGGADNPLQQSIICEEAITLRYWQNVFSLHFTALSFSHANKNNYAYRLRGFDDKWISTGREQSATFTNLSAGNYVFEVKASNNDGVWNNRPAALRIRVLPPPWRSGWAYLLYAAALVALLSGLHRYRVRREIQKLEEKGRLEKVRFEEREGLRRQNAADFHDELGHRLTKIALFLELTIRQLPENNPLLATYLAKIREHTAGLSAGLRDLIWTLDPGQDNLFQTLERLQEFGHQLFDQTGIAFKTQGISPALAEIELPSHVRKHLLLIFKEVMHNSLKHAGAQQAILQVNPENRQIRICFDDDGKGFAPETASTGYGLKNIRERARKIGARLEIDSEPGRGCNIQLIFKKPQMPHTG
ncbi:MAG: hypothetical protein IPM36_04565 [Lewinellaceae bacterium]|nr:hypothetical protein [Lewinellaceae bacterium]